MRSGQDVQTNATDLFSAEEKQAGLAYLATLMEEGIRDAACYTSHQSSNDNSIESAQVDSQHIIMGLKRQFLSQKNLMHDVAARSRMEQYFRRFENDQDVDPDKMLSMLHNEEPDESLTYSQMPARQGRGRRCICELCVDMRHISENIWPSFTPVGATQTILYDAIQNTEMNFCS